MNGMTRAFFAASSVWMCGSCLGRFTASSRIRSAKSIILSSPPWDGHPVALDLSSQQLLYPTFTQLQLPTSTIWIGSEQDCHQPVLADETCFLDGSL